MLCSWGGSVSKSRAMFSNRSSTVFWLLMGSIAIGWCTATSVSIRHPRPRPPIDGPARGTRPHHEVQRAAGHDLRVADHRCIERLAVERGRLDVHIAGGVVLRVHGER